MTTASPARRPFRAAAAALTALALAVAGVAVAAPARADASPRADASRPAERTVISDAAVFEWAVNGSSQGASASGACGYFVAGVGDGTEASYKTVDEDLTIIKRSLSGAPIRVTAENRCAPVDDSDGAQRLRYENGHATKGADGVVTVAWKGAFTVYAYGGLVPWSVQHPTLTIRPDGTGTVTADLLGYASSMDNPDVKVPLEPARDQTVLDLKDVSIDGDEIRATPVYAGVDYFPLTADGTRSTSSAIGDAVKAANPAWGSWPRDFVDFQYRTGLASYWHTSGGGADPQKPPLPVVLSLAGEKLEYVDLAGLAITAQPVKAQAVTGTTATFSVSATSAQPLSYQWQVQRTFGGAWTDVEGASARELVLTDVARTASPLPKYRVLVSDGVQRIASSAVTLEVKDAAAPTTTLQPSDQVGFEGSTVRLQVRASGFPAVRQQWQISRDGGTSWQDYGDPADTLTITNLPVSLDGVLFRAVGGNGVGTPVVSGTASLRVLAATHPSLAVHPGEPARFAYPVDPAVRGRVYVVAGGLPASGLPELAKVGVVEAASWAARGAGFSEADLLAVTTVQTASNVVNGTFGPAFVELPAGLLDLSKAYVAVLLSGAAGDRTLDASVPILLMGQSAPTVSAQAAATTVDAGGDVVLTATVAGTPTPTLRWQRQVAGGEWDDIPGATASTFTDRAVTASASYRVVAANGLGRVESAPVTVTVVPPVITEKPVITAQPVSVLAPAVPAEGEPVVEFAVTASGADSILWQKRVGDDWSVVGTGPALSYRYTPADAGAQVRAVVSNAGGSTESVAATLTLGDYATAALPDAAASVEQGAALRLAGTVGGTAAVARWQTAAAGSAEWTDVDGSTGATLSIASAAVRDGQRYRLVVSSPVPTSVGGPASVATSGPVTVSLTAPTTPRAAATAAQLDAAPRLEVVGVSGRAHTILVGALHAGRHVDVWVHSEPRHLGWQRVDGGGRTEVTLPADLASGSHRIALLDEGGAVIGTVAVTVGSDGAVRSGSPGTLAVTGSELPAALAMLGGLMLLTGLMATLSSRRGRRG